MYNTLALAAAQAVEETGGGSLPALAWTIFWIIVIAIGLLVLWRILQRFL